MFTCSYIAANHVHMYSAILFYTIIYTLFPDRPQILLLISRRRGPGKLTAGQLYQFIHNQTTRECQTTRGGSDKYADTKPGRAGRRAALPIARVYNETTREGQTTRGRSDKYTDTKPSVIKKELAEGQLYQLQEPTARPQEEARSQEKALISTQTPSQV